MSKYTVYKHICPNSKIYIGITQQEPNKRWLNGLGYQTQRLFSKAIKKYGWQNIEHVILFTGLTREEAESIEIELISEYKSDIPKYGYNLDKGGKTAGKMSEETKRIIGEKAKIRMTGRKLSEETKRRIGEKSKGNTYGRNASEETRRKLSNAAKINSLGRVTSDKTKQKLRGINTGKKLSDETKRKISERKRLNNERK